MQVAGYILIDNEGQFIDCRPGAILDLGPFDRWSIEQRKKGYKVSAVSADVFTEIHNYYWNGRYGMSKPRLDIRPLPRVMGENKTLMICSYREYDHETTRRMLEGLTAPEAKTRPIFIPRVVTNEGLHK